MTGSTDDPYGTADLRRTVVAGWTAAPARFREDANAEEDFALGGYRDRVLVELAQNAADAAARAGVAGRLRFTLDGSLLTASNTGAPLDAAGVASLATLRASAKRAETGEVGRFGVGFAAVVAVSDEPAISSAGGAVRWSRADSRAVVAAVPELAGELSARAGNVPVLRLPYPAGAGRVPPPEPGFATTVTLPLRDPEAVDQVRGLLAGVGPALLLGLPALAEVEIVLDGRHRRLTAEYGPGGVTTVDGGRVTRWRVRTDSGTLDPGLLADRPTEERGRTGWSVGWALPLGGWPEGTPAVVHAPTPTGERLGLPALLIASFPLAPDRRQVAPGPLTDFLVDRAAAGYAALFAASPPDPGLLDLVPGPIAAGELDARIRRAVLTRLRDTAVLPLAAEPGRRARPEDTVVLDPAGPGGPGGPAAADPRLIERLAPVLPGLLPAGWPARSAALGALGVRVVSLAEAVDALAGLDRPPGWWRELYGALAGEPAGGSGASAGSRAGPRAGTAEALAALPVPLADGRLVRGPRGLLLPAGGLNPDRLGPLPVRVVHPAAAHPLLARLGAVEAGPRAVLDDPVTRAAVLDSARADDPDALARAVLDLVVAARVEQGERDWLAELTLPGADGDRYPAGELLFPDAPLAGVLEPGAPFGIVHGDLLDRYGPDPLAAVGVLRTFAVFQLDGDGDGDGPGVPIDEDDLDLDRADEWLAAMRDRAVAPDGAAQLLTPFAGVRDLELVDRARWPRAVEMITSDPPARAALLRPARLLRPDGRVVEVASYTAWWLSGRPVLGGRRPGELRLAGGDPVLRGLYDDAPAGLDEPVARALGVRTTLAALLADPDGPGELLDRLGDPARPVSRAALRRLWIALADVDPADVDPPERVRAVRAGEVVVVAAGEAVVVEAPDLLAVLADRPLVLAPYDLAERLAELLDLPLGGELVAAEAPAGGERRTVPAALAELLPAAPRDHVHHDRLVVDGRAVEWRFAEGVVHAATPAGLARGLAWAAGRWELRHLAEAVLGDPAAAALALAEADLDP